MNLFGFLWGGGGVGGCPEDIKVLTGDNIGLAGTESTGKGIGMSWSEGQSLVVMTFLY